MAIIEPETRKRLVRGAYDLLRRIEGPLSPAIDTPPRSFAGRSFVEGRVTEPVIAMTFDDGPHPENTPRLLDILAARGVKATFYLIGKQVSQHPEVAQRTLAEGHEIGSHTWSHRFLTTQTAHSIARELESAHRAIESALGTPPTTLRPPFGAVTRQMTRWIDHQFGYPVILWSVSAQDWEDPSPGVITERLVSRARPGSVILNHDIYTPTVEAMAGTIDQLLERGFRFTTVSDLLGLRSGPGTAPTL